MALHTIFLSFQLKESVNDSICNYSECYRSIPIYLLELPKEMSEKTIHVYSCMNTAMYNSFTTCSFTGTRRTFLGRERELTQKQHTLYSHRRRIICFQARSRIYESDVFRFQVNVNVVTERDTRSHCCCTVLIQTMAFY